MGELHFWGAFIYGSFGLFAYFHGMEEGFVYGMVHRTEFPLLRRWDELVWKVNIRSIITLFCSQM